VRIEAPRSESQARYLRSLLWLGLAALTIIAISGGVAVWLSRRLHRPIDELRAWAASNGNSDRPPPDPTGIAEIDGLRDALVTSRVRIDELLQRERSFSAQVSHQLRTPVAAMRVAIEAELEAPRSDPATVLRESVGQLDRLESTISSLLALARDTARSPVECDVDEFLTARVAEWTPATDREGRPLTVSATAGRVSIDAEAVGHVIDVLLDNAVRHGQGSITVAAERRDDRLVVDVADAGPTPATTDAFAERGTDSSHGIGLRLARSLAESCGGTLRLLDGPTTTFRLTVPV
jgi:signal transduction histidine kinase